MPAVSVLMYVRNGMPYFDRAIKSVLNQTLSNIEILVIDGGSTDGTRELVREYESKDKRVRMLSCDVGSVGAQFNMGLREAKGEYIGIVESDDYILPDMYEKEYACAKKVNCDVLRADNYIFFELNGEEVTIRTCVSHKADNYGKILSSKSEPDKNFIGGSYWTGIYKREFLLDNNIWENETKGAAYQDFGFLFLTSALAQSIYFMKDAFYCYRKDNLLSSCNSPRGVELVETEFKYIKDNLKQRGLWDNYKSYYYLWKIRNERWFYKNLQESDKQKFLEYAYDSIYADMQECDIPDEQWNKKELDFIKAIRKSADHVGEYLKQDDIRWSKSCEMLKGLSDDEQLYIFGAGNLGEIIYKYLVGRGLSPKAYVDNNTGLWGTKKGGVKIISPAELIATKDATVVVCSENYAEEIANQLQNENVEPDRIILCNDMDSCVRFFMKMKNEK